MRRTNLVLDEHLLSEAMKVLSARTYSSAVNTALEEVIRLRKIQSIPQFGGSEIWKGDLSEMRRDQLWNSKRRTSRSR